MGKDGKALAPLRALSILFLGISFVAVPFWSRAEECGAARDFLTMKLSGSGDPIERALEMSYSGLDADFAKGVISLPSGASLAFLPARVGVSGKALMDGATIGDQFTYLYPLAFSLEERKQSFFDPGRVRNEAFFRELYFGSRSEARKSLAKVIYRGQSQSASFLVTRKYCMHIQLKAALEEIASHGKSMDRFFTKVGGSFNWRLISGTNRLSSHSFGTAIDVNTQLGKYWKWTGAKEGKVGRYANEIPQALVMAMERRGFIWGGKWNNFRWHAFRV